MKTRAKLTTYENLYKSITNHKVRWRDAAHEQDNPNITVKLYTRLHQSMASCPRKLPLSQPRNSLVAAHQLEDFWIQREHCGIVMTDWVLCGVLG